jgi:hypothetical protein
MGRHRPSKNAYLLARVPTALQFDRSGRGFFILARTSDAAPLRSRPGMLFRRSVVARRPYAPGHHTDRQYEENVAEKFAHASNLASGNVFGA